MTKYKVGLFVWNKQSDLVKMCAQKGIEQVNIDQKSWGQYLERMAEIYGYA